MKAFRWASDRIGDDGVIAFITNDAFIDAIAADGIRKHLAIDFDAIYVLDLGGNVRRNPRLSGTTHNGIWNSGRRQHCILDQKKDKLAQMHDFSPQPE